jgi:hypothetical protein
VFGALGSLPLGGFPEQVLVVVVVPTGAHRPGRKWEIPDRIEPPEWEESLAKAREALWLKRYNEASRIEDRDENLQSAWTALARKFADERNLKPREEVKRVYYDKIPEPIRQRMRLVEQRVDAHRAILEEEVILKRAEALDEARLTALRMANEAKAAEKERQDAIYKQRVKNLKKARKAKAKNG